MKKIAKKLIHQQGDLLLYLARALPDDAQRIQTDRSSLILAEGEATGHAHRIEATPDVELYEKAGVMYLRVLTESKLRHEEHAEHLIAPGVYEVGRVREVDPFTEEIRTVKD